MNQDLFANLARMNPHNRTILEQLPALSLPDCWLVSGALFQTVWNAQTGRAPDYGIKDYDIFYFDPDTSWEAEDDAIGRARTLFEGTGIDVEVRNQARVHLWYERKFAMPYPALTCATDGIDRFLMPCAQVGIPIDAGSIVTYAPKGFDDIEAMIIQPNRTANFNADRYLEKALRWQTLWPELTLVAP